MRAHLLLRNFLVVLFAALTFIVSSHAAEKLIIDGLTGVTPLVAALAKAHQAQNPGTTIEIGKGLGTKERIQALTDGTIDIAMASHGLDVADIRRQGMLVHEIAKVPVLFGVNASVPVTNVSDAQVCDIYSGKTKNWKDVGGSDLAIVVLTRPDSEVDAIVVREKIACLTSLKMPDSVKVIPGAGAMAKELATTPGAIGMTTMTVVEQSQNQVKPLALQGIAPTAENVQRQTYLLARDSFLVVKTPASATAVQFLEFIRSPSGAKVIAANGAVPVK